MLKSYDMKPLLVGGLLLLAGIESRAADIQGMRFQDWGGNCVDKVCYIQQVLSKGEEPYMVTVIGYAQGNPYPTVIFELPKETNVKDGITLKVDSKASITFSGDCDEKGICRAGFALDPRMMKQFKKGRQATVSFTRGKDKQQESLPLSLMGITHGLNLLK